MRETEFTGADTGFYFGVHRVTVARWAKAGCPRLKNGKYDLRQVISWRYDQLKTEISNEPVSELTKKALCKVRQERGQILELKRKAMEQDLMPMSDVIDGWNMQILVARNNFRGLMSKIMPPLFEALGREGSAQVGALIEKEVERILVTMGKTSMEKSEALLEKEKKQRKPTRRKPKKRTKKGTAQ